MCELATLAFMRRVGTPPEAVLPHPAVTIRCPGVGAAAVGRQTGLTRSPPIPAAGAASRRRATSLDRVAPL